MQKNINYISNLLKLCTNISDRLEMSTNGGYTKLSGQMAFQETGQHCSGKHDKYYNRHSRMSAGLE